MTVPAAQAVRSPQSDGSQTTFLRRVHPAIYVIVLVVVAAATYAHQLLADSIFACPANGYTGDRYLAYCQAKHYGDYEHGAYWFDLEPQIYESAGRAQVMFMGNSRLQWAFSNATTQRWFSTASLSYYLLGFSYYETYRFEEELLGKLGAHARVYVINLDGFFVPTESEPMQYIVHDEEALGHYRGKQRWQSVHHSLCSSVSVLCGHEYAVYRSRETGTWYPFGGSFQRESVSENPVVDPDFVRQQVELGRAFLSRLAVKPDCVIFTIVPTFKTRRAAAEVIASQLGVPLISPTVDGLYTFDGSHLERASAERWATEFLRAAEPWIKQCLKPVTTP
jgi:hypothetical protein